jgi:hypothetical protein
MKLRKNRATRITKNDQNKIWKKPAIIQRCNLRNNYPETYRIREENEGIRKEEQKGSE